MVHTYKAADWDRYKMNVREPHAELEPADSEIRIVDEVLALLHQAGILPHTRYDAGRFLAFRKAVRDHFEIPWTAITPRMQRLIWAINAIVQPANMIAAGVFCGNTFISNAGAAVGPGAVYTASNLIGVEIKPDEARRADATSGGSILPASLASSRMTRSRSCASSMHRCTCSTSMPTARAVAAKGSTWTSWRPAMRRSRPAAWYWRTIA